MLARNLDQLTDKAIVVLKAAPTYLVALATIVGIFVDELAEIGPLPPIVMTILLSLVAVIGAAVTIIRRVTPVLESARGIMPTSGPYTDAEQTFARRLENRQ